MSTNNKTGKSTSKKVPTTKKPANKTVSVAKKKIKIESNKDLLYRMQDSVSKVMS